MSFTIIEKVYERNSEQSAKTISFRSKENMYHEFDLVTGGKNQKEFMWIQTAAMQSKDSVNAITKKN